MAFLEHQDDPTNFDCEHIVYDSFQYGSLLHKKYYSKQGKVLLHTIVD